MHALDDMHRIHRRLIDTLYTEAMVLADEARSYFDAAGREERGTLDAMTRVAFSCESLKVTTRLMHVIAWLLTQRAVDCGEMPRREALDPSRRLGDAPTSDPEVIARMPDQARAVIDASIDLHRRAAHLDGAQAGEVEVESPARKMMARLTRAF